jgi:hypothetical protein
MILVAHQMRVRRALLGTALVGGAGSANPTASIAGVPDHAPARGDGIVRLDELRPGPLESILRQMPSERAVPATSYVGPCVLTPVGSA